MKLQTRNQFPHLLKDMGLVGAAAFIGVAEGDWEFSFLKQWPGSATLIDVWRILNAPGYSGHGEGTDEGQEARYQRVLSHAAKFNGRCSVWRATSIEAAQQIPDGSLDFAYVDSDHSLEAAREDIAAWWPKVKSRGILAGHDHIDGPVHGGSQVYGVKTAVREAAEGYGIKEINVTLEKDWPSFWLVKP